MMVQKRIKSEILRYLLDSIEQIHKQIQSIEEKNVLKILNLSDEDLKILGIDVPEVKKTKRPRILSKEEILESQFHCDTAKKCAKYLSVSYEWYKKCAKIHSIFKTNKWSTGSRKKVWIDDKGKYPLNQILQGKFPNYGPNKIKRLLFKSGIKKEECENCGFNEQRITDNKIPLFISFKDGNEKNHLSDNIEILCHNCMFLVGRGY